MDGKNTIEDAPLSSFHWRMILFGSGGWFVDGYILASVAVALTLIKPEFGLSSLETGTLGALALIGIFLGALIGGPLADQLGRRRILTIDVTLFIVASALQYYADGFYSLGVLRLALGIAIGLDYAVATPYMSELTPRKYRGPVLATPLRFGSLVRFLPT